MRVAKAGAALDHPLTLALPLKRGEKIGVRLIGVRLQFSGCPGLIGGLIGVRPQFARRPVGAACLRGGWGPGLAPAGELLFFASPKKNSQKKGDPMSAPPCAALRGEPGAARLRGAPWNSLRACGAALEQPRRVRPRSGCVLRHTRHPANTPPQAQPQGGCTPLGPSLHSASRGAALCACTGIVFFEGRAQRWPVRAPTPFCPCREAQGAGRRVCRRTHPLRALTCRICLNEAAQQRSELCGTPRVRASQAAPARSAGVTGSGSPFLCLLSFGEAKESESPAGARPGPRTRQRHTTSYKNNSY